MTREIIQESSLTDLHQSSVDAFPRTEKRQFSTDTIKITKLQWTPFLGLKTLYIRGLAQNEGREYKPIIVFKKVKYHTEEDARGLVSLATEGKKYLLESISIEDADVLVRCDCKDHFWRFRHYNYLDRSLQGPDRKKYEALYRPGSANPDKAPGLCKHLMVLTKVLDRAGLFG